MKTVSSLQELWGLTTERVGTPLDPCLVSCDITKDYAETANGVLKRGQWTYDFVLY